MFYSVRCLCSSALLLVGPSFQSDDTTRPDLMQKGCIPASPSAASLAGSPRPALGG